MISEMKQRIFVHDTEPLSLYIHIPFCVQKCRYCDFLSFPAGETQRQQYVEALVRQILAGPPSFCTEKKESGADPVRPGNPGHGTDTKPGGPGRLVDTIFLGGGTPSLLTAAQLENILTAIRRIYRLLPDAEITMECNPGTVSLGRLREFRELGINRLSLGVQSFQDEELKLLGRIHTAAEAEEAFYLAVEAGFEQINLDLMSALPGQSLAEHEANLRKAAELGPEHLSVYSLILEEGTRLYDMARQKLIPDLPGEELDREMYHRTGELLSAYGYKQYEISNYAKKGSCCRHNIGYWTGHEYYGIGLGASSLIAGRRFREEAKLGAYLEKYAAISEPEGSAFEDLQVLTPEDRMSEFMFLGLRLCEGVSETEFETRFGEKLQVVYGTEIQRHLRNGLLIREGDRLRLSAKGMDLANYVMSDFV